MKYEDLRSAVCQANKDIVAAGLVLLTWGNASGADHDSGVMAIKPSGVDYTHLTPEDVVVLSLETGKVVEGELRPSSDTPTHLALYRNFEGVGGVVHTHSTYATSIAQAGRPIPCFGTTHADHFFGTIPVSRHLTEEEVRINYELNTGLAIVETFQSCGIDPRQIPGVLVPFHAPFAWGHNLKSAVENAIVLEECARMAVYTHFLNPSAQGIPTFLLEKHFLRKHGPGAYYGQRM